MLEPSDEELLVAAGSDEEAFEAFYRRHAPTVVRFAARHSSSPSDVVNLVSAVWLEVVSSIDRFDARRGSAVGWVLGIAAHLCASDARRRSAEARAVRRFAGLRVLDQDDVSRLEAELDAAAATRLVMVAISSLAQGEREIAELVLVEGLSAGEAASALGVSGAAARMRLARARRTLRRAVPASEAVRVEEVT